MCTIWMSMLHLKTDTVFQFQQFLYWNVSWHALLVLFTPWFRSPHKDLKLIFAVNPLHMVTLYVCFIRMCNGLPGRPHAPTDIPVRRRHRHPALVPHLSRALSKLASPLHSPKQVRTESGTPWFAGARAAKTLPAITSSSRFAIRPFRIRESDLTTSCPLKMSDPFIIDMPEGHSDLETINNLGFVEQTNVQPAELEKKSRKAQSIVLFFVNIIMGITVFGLQVNEFHASYNVF